MTLRLTIALLAALAAGSTHAAVGGKICGELQNAYGPFDYRKAATDFANDLRLVEMGHFPPEVEQGIRGQSGLIGADLDYTLRAFPNHSRALAAMGRMGIKQKSLLVSGAKWPVECYFDRAIRFAPSDGTVRAAYGTYLFARGESDRAMTMFSQAAELEPENAAINYNAGLAFMKQKNFEKANLHAQKAYSLGFPLPGLKNMLVAAGKWDESVRPPPPPAPADDAPAATPALPTLPGSQPDGTPLPKPVAPRP